MKHVLGTCCATALVLLNSCSPEYTGHYTGYVSRVFGLVRARLVLTLDDETATLHWPDGSRLRLRVTRQGERLIVSDARGDALTFQVRHAGDTLHCAQCPELHLPQTWERQRGERPPSAAARPPRGSRAGLAVARDTRE